MGFDLEDQGPPLILTSPDGVTWTQRTSPVTSGTLRGITYGNNTFVTVGFDQINDMHHLILTSPDGVTWTQRASPVWEIINGELNSITYGNGTFVAMGHGRFIAVLNSHDGIFWYEPIEIYSFPIPKGQFDSITYGNGTFVAVGIDHAISPLIPIILTSPDGKTWTQRTSPVTEGYLSGITYANNTFVVVGAAFEYPQLIPVIHTSPDGVTWTQRILPVVIPGQLYGITYANNTFVAVGGDGLIMQSQPGGPQCSLSVTNHGNGTVTSSPSGINCGVTCSASFFQGTSVTLTATADSGSLFKSWSGCTSKKGTTCTVTMHSAKTVTANFIFANPMKLTVSKVKQHSGDGTVISSPEGINCGQTCAYNYAVGTEVTLAAAPLASSTFSGWSGPCSGTDTCTVTMNKAQNVRATFTGPQTLSVTSASVNKGKGTITSNPPGMTFDHTLENY